MVLRPGKPSDSRLGAGKVGVAGEVPCVGPLQESLRLSWEWPGHQGMDEGAVSEQVGFWPPPSLAPSSLLGSNLLLFQLVSSHFNASAPACFWGRGSLKSVQS